MGSAVSALVGATEPGWRPVATLLREMLRRIIQSLCTRPWVLDIIVGAVTLGLGLVFWLHPEVMGRFGFRFLLPIIGQAAAICSSLGVMQLIIALLKLPKVARQTTAFSCFAFYAATMINNESPTAHVAYGGWAMAEALIVLRIY